MGKVTWGGGLSAGDVDKADRSQFTPYGGPKVPDGLYCWRIKVLKRGKSSNKNDQMIVGLELVPRASRPDEKAYAGYFVTDYIMLMESSAFRVAAFTDAIGVTGADLINRTKDTGEKDTRGSIEIVSIGSWKHDKKQLVLAQLATDTDPKSKTGRKISGYWTTEALTQEPTGEADEDEDEDENGDSDDEDGDDEGYSREELEGMKLKEVVAIYLAQCEEDEVEPEDTDDLNKSQVIDLILADDDDEDDAEPEPEPEEPKKAAKKGAKKAAPTKEEPAAAKPKKKAAKAAKNSDDEDENAPF